MIQVSPALAAALNATANQPVDLYELYLDSGTLYYADRAVAWGGHNYLPYVRSRSAIRRFLGGEFDRVTVELANVDTAISQLLAATEIEGRTLIIRRVDLTVADDSLVLFHGRMERASRVTEELASLTAVQLLGSIDHEAPSRKFVTFCPWKFKSDQCGYSGPESECNKSWARCKQLSNTNAYGGFRFVPHGGTYQYTEVEKKRFLLLFSRKSKKTVTATFNAVDDTPYDVPIPIILGRAQIAGIPIQHADEGGVTKVLAAFCVGTISEMKYVRANGELVADWTQHLGQVGGTASQLTDPRFPNAYPYNRVAYVGVTIPSDVRAVDPAPVVDAVILGSIVDLYDSAGNWSGSAWSDNPVWLTRHFMTLSLEEGGMGVPEALIDHAVAYQTAAYCDELVWDATNDQKIYEPSSMPEGMTVGDDYRRYRSTGVYGADPEVDGPYDTYEPGVDDDSSTAPAPIQVKRFTCNAALAKAEKAVDILYKKLLPAFRGYLTLSKEGTIQIRSERPVANSTLSAGVAPGATVLPVTTAAFGAGDVVLIGALTASAEVRTVTAAGGGAITVTPAITFGHDAGAVIHQISMAFDDSTVVGQIEYPLSDRVPSTNRVTIKYVDAPAGFEARELQINSYEHQEQVHKVNNEDLDGSAIDNYFQAWRIGQWRLAKARDLAKFVSFKADIKASRLEVGDVIAVSAAEHGLSAVPFLVEELSFEPDDEVSILGRIYSLSIYNDTAPQATVTVPAVFQPILPGATDEAERSPLDFGAVGDGVTDDTAAVQAALDNLQTVKFPAGYTFLVDGTIAVSGKPKIRIFGAGTIKLKSGAADWKTPLWCYQCGEVTIEGITIDGNRAGQTQPNIQGSLFVRDCGAVTIRDVRIISAKLVGIQVDYYGTGAVGPVSISGCRVENAGNYGIYVSWQRASGSCPPVSISDCVSTGCDLYGLYLEKTDWAAVTGCQFAGAAAAAAVVDGTAAFANCDFDQSGTQVLAVVGAGDYTAYSCRGVADRQLPPPQPADGDVVIGTLLQRKSALGEQFTGVPISVTIPNGSQYVRIWMYEGAEPPASVSLYVESDVTILRGATAPTEWWLPRRSAAYTLHLAFVASSNTYAGVPTATSVTRTVTIPASGPPAALTAATISAEYSSESGVRMGRWKALVSGPADDNREYVAIERWRHDAAWQPIGEPEQVMHGGRGNQGALASYEITQGSFDWQWPRTQPENWKVRAVSVGFDGQRAATSWSNYSLTPGGGVDLGKADPVTVGRGNFVFNNQLISTDKLDITNQNFEHWESDYLPSGWGVSERIDRTSTEKYSGGYAVRAAAHAIEFTNVWWWIPVLPGQRLTLRSYIKNMTGTDQASTSQVASAINWLRADANGAPDMSPAGYISQELGGAVPRADEWTECVASGPAPDEAVYAMLYPIVIWPRSGASGYAYCDYVTLDAPAKAGRGLAIADDGSYVGATGGSLVILNPDFEHTEEDGTPKDWRIFGDCVLDNTVYDAGSMSLKVTRHASQNSRVDQFVRAYPGSSYLMRFRIRVSGGPIDAGIAYHDASFVEIGYAPVVDVSHTAGAFVTVEVNANDLPAGTKYICLIPALIRPSDPVGTTAWVDSVQLFEVVSNRMIYPGVLSDPAAQGWGTGAKPMLMGSVLPTLHSGNLDVYPIGTHFYYTGSLEPGRTDRLRRRNEYNQWVGISGSDITAGTISAQVGYLGSIAAGQVNAGDFSGCTLTLSKAYVKVMVDVFNDTAYGQYAGLKVESEVVGTAPQRTIITAGGAAGLSKDGYKAWDIATSGSSSGGGALGIYSYSPGSNQLRIALYGNTGTIQCFYVKAIYLDSSGNQVVGSRQPKVGDPTGGSVIDVECREALIALLDRLRMHGLISIL